MSGICWLFFCNLLLAISEIFVTYGVSCRVSRAHYLNTEEFIDAVAEELRARLPKIAKL